MRYCKKSLALYLVHGYEGESKEGLYNCWRRKWQPTPVLLPGQSHGWKSLVGYSSRGRKESDTTE